MSEALAAARRLRARFPVREHRIMDEEAAKYIRGSTRAVRVGDQHFRSVKAAARGNNVSAHTILRMIDDGRASYA